MENEYIVLNDIYLSQLIELTTKTKIHIYWVFFVVSNIDDFRERTSN